MTPYYLQPGSFNTPLAPHAPRTQTASPTIEEEEESLRVEVQLRVREIRRAIDRGEPVAAWRAQRQEVDDVWQRLQVLRDQRSQALRSGR